MQPNNLTMPDGTVLDPKVLKVMGAIRNVESGGNYSAVGDNGDSHGAYQFNKDNYKNWAKQYGVDPNDFSPAAQNKVAYLRMKAMKDEGNGPEDIAARWNGSTLDPKTNRYNYNNPDYGVKFRDALMGKPVTPQTTNNPDLAKQDVSTTGTDTYGALVPAAPTDNPLKAGLKSLANVPSSLLNLGKSLFSAAAHPINTIKGVGNAFAGGIEEGYNALVGEEGAHNKQTETFDALKHALNERYGSLENAQRTATNDPVGFGADVFSILEGGASLADKFLGEGVETAGLSGEALKNAQKANAPVSTALDTAVTKVASPVVNAGSKILGAPFSIGAKILGQSTGVGSEAIKTGFNAATEGGEASKAFTEGLRGDTTPEDLVDKARGALDEVVDTRRNNYKEMLGSLKSDTSAISMDSLKTQLDKQLENFNITKDAEGKLDFSESTFVNPSDQRAIEGMTKDVENWKNNTPQGIDTLKQRLGNYWEPGSKTGAFSEGLRSEARNLIEKTPGYSDAMKNYSEMSDQIKDIKQSLSLGDKAAVETSFNKLKNALKNDKQFRLSVIQELDKDTGGSLQESIAGMGMSKLAPSGLSKLSDIGIGVGAHFAGVGIMPLLGMALTTSPRIVGEIVNALGLGARGTKVIMSYVNKFATPAVIAGSAASK